MPVRRSGFNLAIAAMSVLLSLSFVNAGCRGGTLEGGFSVESLADLETLAHYTQVKGTIVVKNTPIEALVLPKLERAGGLIIEEIAPNLRIVSLPALRAIDVLKIEDDPPLERVELPRLVTASTVTVSGCDAIEALELPALERLHGLEIRDNRRLRSASLPALTQVVVAELHDNPKLERLHLPALTTASRLEVSGHAALPDLELPALTRLDQLRLTRNAALREVRLDRLDGLEDFEHEDNAVLVRLHTPRLPGGSPRSRPFARRDASLAVADPEVFLARRGDLRQLTLARVGDERRLVLGYRRQDRAVFEARDAATGELIWTSQLEPEYAPKHQPPASWPTTVPGSAGPDFVTVHLEDGRFEATGWDESQDKLVGQVVGLDLRTGAELWRAWGSRSWVLGRAVLIDGLTPAAPDPGRAQPQAAFHLPSTYTLHAVQPLEDVRAAVMHLFDLFDMVTFDGQGRSARFGFRGAPVFGPRGQVAMLCARDLTLGAYPDLPGPFQPCPDPGPELVPLPPRLAVMARGVLAPEPSGRRYLATTDGRVAPRPVRWGGALMEPAHEGVVPVAFTGSRLALVDYDLGEPPRHDRLHLAALDPASPSMTAVEGLGAVLISGQVEVLGRHLVFLTRTGDESARALRLVDLETAAVELTLPLGPARLATHDGLIGFDLDLGTMGPVTVWIGAPADQNASPEASRPEVVAAYQLRDAGDRHRPIAIDLASATPETAALGEGLHAVRLRVDGSPHLVDDTNAGPHGGALIDIRARRLVWSDLDTVRLVDFTEELRERWSSAWRDQVCER